MSEKKQVFGPLRLRCHEASSLKKMPYDERYTEYIEPLGLLPFIHMAPDEIVNKRGEKLRVSAGATFTWISQNFKTCPEGASRDLIKLYARVYVWYVITRTLFPDCSGNTAQWHWLKALTKMETKWSWGSAALAFLYRQLDEACCRISKDACIGGPLLLLSIWSWERFPVGRPRVLDYKNYNDHGNQLRRPTWAYQWDIVSEFSGDPIAAYQTYTNEIEFLVSKQSVVQVCETSVRVS
ncbi:serine/threonine-protein phosphatase 7 long form homolog [Lolium perenne]|uniref:serine/threonine-protein phosphatase 7 long form homolog n=1 Tax=Lolium perenne TaxID=4522 RepID=UPI003A98FA90